MAATTQAKTVRTKAPKTTTGKAGASGPARTEKADQGAAMAEDVVTQLQNGGQQAIGAVRRFLEKVDESLAGDRSPSAVQEIADSALEMSDRMVEHGGDALKSIVASGRQRFAA